MLVGTKKIAKLFSQWIRMRCKLEHNNNKTVRQQSSKNSKIQQRPSQQLIKPIVTKTQSVEHSRKRSRFPSKKAEKKIWKQPSTSLWQRYHRIQIFHLKITWRFTFQGNYRWVHHYLTWNWQPVHTSER